MLQLISVLLVTYSYFFIRTSIPKLPKMIPTHFNAAGVANGWGSPDTLWFLLVAQALTCAVFLAVPYIGQSRPGSVHFGSRRLSDFPAEQRERLLPLLKNLGGMLSLVTNLFFVFMLRQNIHAALEPIPHSDMRTPMMFLLAGTLSVIVYYMVRLGGVARNGGSTGG